MPKKTKAVRKPAKKLVSPKTAAELFAVLRKFFAEGTKVPYGDRQKVWDALTALRGPDGDGDSVLKRPTTGVIRHALFGDFSTIDDFAVFNQDDSYFQDKRRTTPFGSGHFRRHAERAFFALNLKW